MLVKMSVISRTRYCSALIEVTHFNAGSNFGRVKNLTAMLGGKKELGSNVPALCCPNKSTEYFVECAYIGIFAGVYTDTYTLQAAAKELQVPSTAFIPSVAVLTLIQRELTKCSTAFF